jgi:hypothetical protein
MSDEAVVIALNIESDFDLTVLERLKITFHFIYNYLIIVTYMTSYDQNAKTRIN